MTPAPVNVLAVLVAAVLNMVAGALWYSPLLFARQWVALSGVSEERMREVAGIRAYGLLFAASLVMAFVLAQIVIATQSKTIFDGLQAGFLVWLGFVATTSGANYLFEGRPRRLFAINTGYALVALMLMGALLAVWA